MTRDWNRSIGNKHTLIPHSPSKFASMQLHVVDVKVSHICMCISPTRGCRSPAIAIINQLQWSLSKAKSLDYRGTGRVGGAWLIRTQLMNMDVALLTILLLFASWTELADLAVKHHGINAYKKPHSCKPYSSTFPFSFWVAETKSKSLSWLSSRTMLDRVTVPDTVCSDSSLFHQLRHWTAAAVHSMYTYRLC